MIFRYPSREVLIVGFLTVLLCTGTMLVKWYLVKSIHEEIVQKYNNNQSIYFQQNSMCQVINYRDEFNIITFPLSIFLLILFSITTTRKSFQRNRCFNGHIGLAIPFDFFAETKRTFAAVIFMISADEILDIANNSIQGKNSSPDQGKFPNQVDLNFVCFSIEVLNYDERVV